MMVGQGINLTQIGAPALSIILFSYRMFNVPKPHKKDIVMGVAKYKIVKGAFFYAGLIFMLAFIIIFMYISKDERPEWTK